MRTRTARLIGIVALVIILIGIFAGCTGKEQDEQPKLPGANSCLEEAAATQEEEPASFGDINYTGSLDFQKIGDQILVKGIGTITGSSQYTLVIKEGCIILGTEAEALRVDEVLSHGESAAAVNLEGSITIRHRNFEFYTTMLADKKFDGILSMKDGAEATIRGASIFFEEDYVMHIHWGKESSPIIEAGSQPGGKPGISLLSEYSTSLVIPNPNPLNIAVWDWTEVPVKLTIFDSEVSLPGRLWQQWNNHPEKPLQLGNELKVTLDKSNKVSVWPDKPA